MRQFVDEAKELHQWIQQQQQIRASTSSTTDEEKEKELLAREIVRLNRELQEKDALLRECEMLLSDSAAKFDALLATDEDSGSG